MDILQIILFIFLFTLFAYILLIFVSILPFKHNSLRYYSKFCLFIYHTGYVSFVLLPYCLIFGKHFKTTLFASYLIRSIKYILRIEFILKNEHFLKNEESGVLISNHQSFFDILGLFNCLDKIGKLAPVAKKELFYVFPFGPACYFGGVIFIDRLNHVAAIEKLNKNTKLLLKNKWKIFYFCEGTRNLKKHQPILPFKKGAFYTAIDAQVPIIPLVYSPYYFLNSTTYFFDCPAKVTMNVLEPIPTKGLTNDNVPELMEKVRSLMIENYKKMLHDLTSHFGKNYPGILK